MTETKDPLEVEPRVPGEPPPEVRRDQWGRYLLPHPESGKLQPWTRATTYAKSASDTFALAQWQNRMVAKGMSMRPDLYALAASTHPDDKDVLNRIAEQAKEAAGGSAASSIGTALHAFTEQQDRGESPVVPEPWTDNVSLYTKCLADHSLAIDPNFIETVVIVPEFGVAGTLDRLGRLPQVTHLRVVDLKTGKDLSYGWMEIAVQLFLYSRATHWYDVATGELHEMPKVDQDVGNVIHLPVNKKTAALYEVDLTLGSAVAHHIGPIREFRKRKDYARLVSPPIEAVDPAAKGWSEPAEKPAKAAARFKAEKDGNQWVIRSLVNDRLVPNTDVGSDGSPLRFRLKKEATAHIAVLMSPAAIGQKAAADIAAMKNAEEWPEDEKTETAAPASDGADDKDPWMALIFQASSYRELQDYYRRGHPAGTWNERHTKAAAVRKAELEEIEREIANAPAAEPVELPENEGW